MTQDYESVVRESFRRMSTEELIERKERGNLTQEAAGLIEAELVNRAISKEEYDSVIKNFRDEEFALIGLPDGISKLDLASPWIRLIAHIFDHIFAISLLVISILLSESLVLIGVLAYVLYYIFSDALPGGKSIGKRIVRIEVLGLKHLKSCTLIQALKRNIIMMIPLIGLLDMVSIFGYRNQRWGDRWAETIVVKSRR